jgi:hypothetical protein
MIAMKTRRTHLAPVAKVTKEGSPDYVTVSERIATFDNRGTQRVKIVKLPVSFQFGGRYYAEKPSGGPDWGLRFAITFVFPK